jgi:hypothetical protein
MSASVAEIKAALVMHRGDAVSAAADLMASARPPGWKMNYRKNIPGRAPDGNWTNTEKKIEIAPGEFVPILYGLIKPTSTATSADGYVYSYDKKTNAVGIIFLRGPPNALTLKIALKAVKADFAGVDSEKDLLYRHAFQHWGKTLPIHMNGKAEKRPKVKKTAAVPAARSPPPVQTFSFAFPKDPVVKPKTPAPPRSPVQTGSASGQPKQVPTVRVEYYVTWVGEYGEDTYWENKWYKTEFLLQVDTPATAALLTARLNKLNGIDFIADDNVPVKNWKKLVRDVFKERFPKRGGGGGDGPLYILDIQYPQIENTNDIPLLTTQDTVRIRDAKATPLHGIDEDIDVHAVEFQAIIPYDPYFVKSLANIDWALEKEPDTEEEIVYEDDDEDEDEGGNSYDGY